MNQNKPTVPEIMPLVNKLYERHSAGCCLHIVLDDGNIKLSDVEFCMGYAKAKEHKECFELAALLSKCSITQRRHIYRNKYK